MHNNYAQRYTVEIKKKFISVKNFKISAQNFFNLQSFEVIFIICKALCLTNSIQDFPLIFFF